MLASYPRTPVGYVRPLTLPARLGPSRGLPGRFRRPSGVTGDDRRMVAELVGLVAGNGARHLGVISSPPTGRYPEIRAPTSSGMFRPKPDAG